MIGGWYDGWAEDLESWEEVVDLLRAEWDRISCPSLGLSLERADGLLAFDLRGQWRARHRRGLHRLGFRKLALPRTDAWLWDVEPHLRSADLSRFASPVESIFGSELSAANAARVVRLRTSLARDHLVREQALRVLREVFRCEPRDLEILMVQEPTRGRTRMTTPGRSRMGERPSRPRTSVWPNALACVGTLV